MTTAETTRRPGVAAAIRAIAALTVIGSAAAVTALTVLDDDQRPVASTSTGQHAGTAANAPAAPVAAAPAAPGVDAPAAVPPAAATDPNAVVPPGEGPAASVALGGPGATVALNPGGGPAASVPLNPGAGPAASVPLNSAPGASVPPATDPGAGTPLAAANPFATAPVDTQPACPLGWPAPKQQGGLASLIGLAPLAGPFSSEAFALGSVYQPILRLVGPVLAEISPVITQHQPLIDPIIAQVQGVEAIVLEAILPYYGPYRAQLIAAEGELAKTLAPILDRAYNSEIASCFVAWQGQIIDRSKGGRITVASLAHPGTVVELGPKD
ncbi:hypothetical protein [Nocardia sp. NPDC057668]|uniref:hypothetical protein n=1 Tax=Nocardia sp. NPDC057668 TaxID=3346202 RepID=UPI00366BE95D